MEREDGAEEYQYGVKLFEVFDEGLLHVMLPLSTIDPAKAGDMGSRRSKLTASRGKRFLSDRQEKSQHIKEASLEGQAAIEIS